MQNVLEALNAAGLPPFVTKTSLPNENQNALRQFVANAEFKTTEGLQSYRVVGDDPDQVIRVVSVLAKELVLSKAGKVVFIPAALMRHHAAFYELHGEYSAATSHFAQMRIAVFPDLFTGEWFRDEAERGLTLQMIQRLYFNGVMLILGDWQNGSYGDRTFDQLATSFQALNIA